MDGVVGFSSEVSVHSVGEKEREGRGTSQWREGGPESQPPDLQRSPREETQPQDRDVGRVATAASCSGGEVMVGLGMRGSRLLAQDPR